MNDVEESPSVKINVDQGQTPLMTWVNYMFSGSSLDVNIATLGSILDSQLS